MEGRREADKVLLGRLYCDCVVQDGRGWNIEGGRIIGEKKRQKRNTAPWSRSFRQAGAREKGKFALDPFFFFFFLQEIPVGVSPGLAEQVGPTVWGNRTGGRGRRNFKSALVIESDNDRGKKGESIEEAASK